MVCELLPIFGAELRRAICWWPLFNRLAISSANDELGVSAGCRADLMGAQLLPTLGWAHAQDQTVLLTASSERLFGYPNHRGTHSTKEPPLGRFSDGACAQKTTRRSGELCSAVVNTSYISWSATNKLTGGFAMPAVSSFIKATVCGRRSCAILPRL